MNGTRGASRPHVALYMPDFESGGVQRMNLNLAPKFVAGGFDVTLVVHEKKGSFAVSVPDTVDVVSLNAGRAMAAIRPLSHWLKARRPDILLSSLGHPNMIALLANRLAGRPSRVIVSQRNHLSTQSRNEKEWQHRIVPFLYRRYLGYADAIVAVSEGVADDLAQVAGVPRARVAMIYNPAVPDDIDQRAAEPVAHPWFNDGAPTAIAVGRLVSMKDYPTMLRAIAKVPGLRLAVLGEGDQRASLETLAATLGITGRVDFIGFALNPQAYIARASMLVLSSRYEGFGNVIAEALACGTAVVATDCPSGPAEIVAHGAFGRLVPVGDVDALAAAIRETLENPGDAAARRARGRHFSVDRAAEQYMALFRATLVSPATA